MDDTVSKWQKLKCYMETEKILLSSFSEKNKVIRTQVRTMDWPVLEILLKELDDLSCQIEETDRRRHQIYKKILKKLDKSENYPFFDNTASLPAELRENLRRLHGELKILSDQIKIESRVTSIYVEARTRALKDMLGELIPETKNVFYSPSGQLFKGSTGTSSLLVNRSL